MTATRSPLGAAEFPRFQQALKTAVDATQRRRLRLKGVGINTTAFATEVTVDHRALNARHWDYAYATTVYSSQGRTRRTPHWSMPKAIWVGFFPKGYSWWRLVGIQII